MSRNTKNRSHNRRRRNRSNRKPVENAEPKNDLTRAPTEPKPIHIDKKELRESALDRAKNRPIRERILSFFRREKDKDYKELIINTEALERRVAMMENGILQGFDVERLNEDRMVGAIFKGKVQNLEPGLKAAFVDIGQEKNAFLHYWDMLPGANNDPSIEIVRENKKKSSGKNEAKSIKDIPRAFPIGSEIVVQITKAQIGSKGPRTTTNLSLPGRFLVLMPYAGQCGISRKIEEKSERTRLKRILSNLSLREGMGVIIRTAGQNKPERFFDRDLHLLLQQWDEIEAKMQSQDSPAFLYEEPDLIGLTARDFLTDDIDRVQVDNKDDYNRLIETIQRISPKSKSKVSHFDEEIPIFERFNVERQIEQTFMRRVLLPSGGEIVMEETEALVSIDVNTGSHKGDRKDGKNFILQANIEAAMEVCRQMRLRNLGGLVIVDFIDMKNKNDQRKVFQKMKASMADDKAKHNILPISQLGIMQITRQRHDESNSSGVYEPCPYCNGRGIVKSPRSVSIEIQRKITSAVRRSRLEPSTERNLKLKVFLHPSTLRRLRGPDSKLVERMERNYDLQIEFEASDSYHLENFKIIDLATDQEVR
ncbi:MAG: Rne/Rng family ribonuclease [Verrucomicrobiota bacterium]|jgi:ribonuclease G|nr:ribonuclease E/G [Opitutales bacterium]MEC8657023.1 Rne/Rng family ribonuclease [Verrucomicrobiota bacterium]HAY74957.1 ribonuclease E/G [Opitutae bacterium]MEC8865623.1 Rne/Rng family ribonuclease [Verrucomicrobiota bacterium]MED5281241.1 Rne/Rng family ribonuclease [Verrucomicrobiota bacterium]